VVHNTDKNILKSLANCDKGNDLQSCSMFASHSVFVKILVYHRLGKGKFVPVLNQEPRHKDILGEWRYSSTHS
jgi:hypothetical protein